MKPHRSSLSIVLSLIVLALLASTSFVSADAVADHQLAPLAGDEPIGRAFSVRLTYFFPAGSTLYSADDSVGSNYNPGACINATNAAGDFFTIHLHLPQGSRIDYLRIYYKDTSANNSTASIRKYDGAGATTTIAEVASAGNGGFGTQLSPYIGHVVDNSDGAYALNWLPSVTGNSMQLCGLRVAYRRAVSEVFLPAVQRR